MITERTLRKWRKEALDDREILKHSMDKRRVEIRERILRLTQELLDQHLLRKPTR
jgi:transposase-like protein